MKLHIPDLDPEASVLDAALAYAAAGWYIAPTDPARDVKNPGTVLGGGWPSKTSRDPKQIAAWFAEALPALATDGLQPEPALKELTTQRRHMFAAAGLFDALPWKPQW